MAFCCDFSHYPGADQHEGTARRSDVSVAHDRHPHLRLLGPGSRLSLRFTLPDKPKRGFLEAAHLASTGATSRDRPSDDWKLTGDPWSRIGTWGRRPTPRHAGPSPRRSDPETTEIEWTAGNLRSHYWLRAVRLHVEYDRATEVAFPLLEVGDELFPEARFSQCSYNALATVLDHFYGVEGWADDRKAFEDGQFVAALKRYDLEPYFGWAPWTSYMAESGRLRWNGRAVNDLKAERFALSNKRGPSPGWVGDARSLSARREGPPGRSLALKIGPGAGHHLDAVCGGDGAGGRPLAPRPQSGPGHGRRAVQPQRHAQRRREPGGGGGQGLRQLATERGLRGRQPETVVATAAAMSGSVRVNRGGGRTLLGDGLPGVEADEFHVSFQRR